MALDLIAWWKGEDNLLDSVGSNNITFWHGAGNFYDNNGFIDGAINRAIGIDYGDSPIGTGAIIANNGAFNFKPYESFSIEFYIKLSSDVSKQRSFYIISKNNYAACDYAVIITNGNLGIRIGNNEYPIGGTLPFDDLWNKVKVSYDNGYWKSFVSDIDVSTLLTQQLITNSYTNDLLLGTSYIGSSFYIKFGIDEIKISVNTPDAWWKFENNITDTIMGGTGSWLGGVTPSYPPGYIGQSVHIAESNGSGYKEIIQLPFDASLTLLPTDTFYIDFYVKVNSVSGFLDLFSLNLVSGTLHITLRGTGLGLGGWPNLDYFTRPSSGVITTGVWHHIVLTYSNGYCKEYLDDVNITLDNTRRLIQTSIENNMALFGLAVATFDGEIDEFKIYKVPTNGLVGWWRGENNAVDSISGMNATWLTTPVYDTGVVGQAFRVNIPADRNGLYIPHNTLFDTIFSPTGTFFFKVWLKINDLTNRFDVFLAPGVWGLFIDRGQIIWDSLNPFVANGTITDTNWHEITFGYIAGTKRIYLDGEDLTADRSINQIGVTGDLYIANTSLYGNPPRNFNGLIDEIRLYVTPFDPIPDPVLNRNVVIICCDA